MKKNKKQNLLLVMMLVIIILLAIFLVIYGISKLSKNQKQDNGDLVVTSQEKSEEEKHVQTFEDGSKLNTSTKLHESKSVDGFTISNIQLTMTNSVTHLVADIKNDSNTNKPMTAFDIILLDDDGNEIYTFGSFIKETTPGETTKLTAHGTLDYANAYDFKVVIK